MIVLAFVKCVAAQSMLSLNYHFVEEGDY